MTTVAPAAAIGRQTPSECSVIPASKSTLGGACADLATVCGLTPDPWQRLVLDVSLGRDRHGKWTASTTCLAVPRQNGKNAVIEMLELYLSAVLGLRILHTAHEIKTARKAFNRIVSFFESKKLTELTRMVSTIRKTNGQEAVHLVNGGSIEFSARTSGAARGFSVDVLIMDEAQDLHDEALAALLPTVSSAPSGDPLIFITGTPPTTRSDGEVWRRQRSEAIAGRSRRTAWLEWSATPNKLGELDIADEATWLEANPALGIRLNKDVIITELGAMSPDVFRRERLGLFEETVVTAVIPLDDWAACRDETAQISGPDDLENVDDLILAIDYGPSMSSAAIVAAWTDPDTGLPCVEVVEHRHGHTRWVAPRAVELVDTRPVTAVIIDGYGQRGSLVEDLQERGVGVTLIGIDYVKTASEQMVEYVVSHRLRHSDQPSLTQAVAAVRRKPVGDRWKLARTPGADADVCPLIGASLALRGLSYDELEPIAWRRPRRRRKQNMPRQNYTGNIRIT